MFLNVCAMVISNMCVVPVHLCTLGMGAGVSCKVAQDACVQQLTYVGDTQFLGSSAFK